MKWTWRKILAIVLLLYTFTVGLLIDVPRQPILHETIRNLFYHVTMWFAMFTLAGFSFYHSIVYLNKEKAIDDNKANAFANAAIFFGMLGLITGMIWVNYSWNSNPDKIVLWVKQDAKLRGAAAGTLIYASYLILRMFVNDPIKRGRFAAVYNIFAFIMLLLFSFVIPRLNESTLHPGNGGNPGFNAYDLDNTMRMVFYPAIIGFSLLGYWLANLRVRITLLNQDK